VCKEICVESGKGVVWRRRRKLLSRCDTVLCVYRSLRLPGKRFAAPRGIPALCSLAPIPHGLARVGYALALHGAYRNRSEAKMGLVEELVVIKEALEMRQSTGMRCDRV
jgi:hypothetical protein